MDKLKDFENKFVSLISNITFDRKQNHFQAKLKEDVRTIKQETRPLIKADKSNNFYKMESEDYKKLVEKEITKDYRKATNAEVTEITENHKDIVSEKCDLCTKEKFHILAQANPNQLNSRNEIFANCMHKKSSLIIPNPRGRKINPG